MHDDKTAIPKIIFDAQRVPKDSYETIEERYKRAKESADRNKQKKQSSLNKLFPGEPIFTMTTWDGLLMSVPASMAESFQKEQEKLKAKAKAGELLEEEPINDDLWNRFLACEPLSDEELDKLFESRSSNDEPSQAIINNEPDKNNAQNTDQPYTISQYRQNTKEPTIQTAPNDRILNPSDPASYKIYKQSKATSSKCIQQKIIDIALIVVLIAQLLFFTPYTLSKVEISKQNVPHYVKMFTVFRSIFFGESGYSEGTIRYVYELDYKRFIFQIAVTVAMYFTVKWFIKQKNET